MTGKELVNRLKYYGISCSAGDRTITLKDLKGRLITVTFYLVSPVTCEKALQAKNGNSVICFGFENDFELIRILLDIAGGRVW